jgi:hypothetical protein
MRAKVGSHFFLVVLAGLVVHASEARADFAECPNPLPACTATSTGCCTGTFSTGGTDRPIIIAMDRCHQPAGSATLSAPGVGAPRKEFSISSISRTSTTVTVVTTANHGATTGSIVRIAGTGNSDLNGTFRVASGCSTCTTFTYSTTSSGAIGTITAGKVLTYNPGQAWCGDSPGSATRIGGSSADDGIVKTYGLVYRLMQRGIPVYWLVNPSKTTLALSSSENLASQSYLASDVDVWVMTDDLADPPTSAVGLTDCLTPGCTQPVQRLNPSSLAVMTDSYRYKQFPVRGGAFLIAAEDRASFNDFWKREGAYASLSPAKYNWPSTGIDLYEISASAKIVHQNFASGDGTSTSPYARIDGAPVAAKIDYEPPRIACVGCSSNVAQAWLDLAGIQDPATAASCASGEFVPSDATYCVLNDYDVAQGTLVSGGFSWLWLFGYNDNSPCNDSAEKAVFDKIRDFMTTFPGIRNAGHSVFLDASIKVAEGCKGKQLMGTTQLTSDGLELKPSGASEPFILRHPQNLMMQLGDFAPSIAGGTLAGWEYYKSGSPTIGYQAALQPTTWPFDSTTLRRLMSVDKSGTNNELCLQHASTAACDAFTPGAATGDLMDVAAYARLLNDRNNGLIYYLPGNQLGNAGNRAELRMLLNSLLALPDETFTTTPDEIEVARSSPIIAEVDAQANVYQGTYVRQDPVPSIPKATTASGLARFTFPYITGHLRAIAVTEFTACSGASCSTSNSDRTAISDMPALFDAANGIPAVSATGCATKFNGSCRTVFTTLKPGRLPAHVDFTTANVTANGGTTTTLGTVLASNLTSIEQQTLIERVLAGKKDINGNWVPALGGVDRSTPAVIGPSPLAGTAGRPTMVYFGATDGMLHAVCASTGGGCDQVGRELWAYLPRTVLPDLRQSTARVDGSPHVIDAYGDFDNNGTNAWHTILLFHTGTGKMTASNVVPAVYAIDITTPNSPRVLWEYAVANVGARGAYEMGVGLNIVGGTVTIAGVNKTVAYMQTNNGGIGGAASVITAIDVENGTKLWQFGDLYPTSGGKSARSSSHEAAPSSGIPGGATVLSTLGNSKVNKVVYGTLYGDVFVRAADTGANQNGTGPLLRISTDYKPIGVPASVYQKGTTQYAVFVTGGYTDSQATLWRGENETTLPLQMAFAVSTAYDGSTINESNTTQVPIKFDLGPGEGGFAQAIVVGDEIFVTTDRTNINDFAFGTSSSPTGKVYRYDFGATVPALGQTMVVASGAGSLFNSGASLINVSGKYGERLTSDALGTTGAAVDPMTTSSKLRRALWLRTE